MHRTPRRRRVPFVAFIIVLGILGWATPANAVAGPPIPAAATSASPFDTVPKKILLYGDSITTGTAAQYTWRYRLWKGLVAAGTSVDFVGPMNTVATYPVGAPTSTEYRDPNFDTDHAAVAGMTLTNPSWTVSSLAGQYQPDVIVGLIGLNDLNHRIATPAQLIDLWRTQIQEARRADPGVSVILGEYGETWLPGISTYDADLSALAQELDRSESRVIATAVPQLNIWRDTVDGVHFTTSGEKIEASVVADVLTQLGLPSGTAPRDPWPVAGELAPAPSASASTSGIALTWPAVDYATSENILTFDLGTGQIAVTRFVTGVSTTLSGVPGHTYRIWLFPVQGWFQLGTYSVPATVTVPTS